MKRLISILLSFLLIAILTACNANSSNTTSTVSFYYLHSEMEYKTNSSTVSIENYDAGKRKSDFAYLLEKYLEGPNENKNTSPFPEGTKLTDITVQDNIAYVTLNDEIAELSDSKLTVACACLTLTTLNITKVESVQIYAQKALLNNAEFIAMDASCILLLDSRDP